MTCSRYGWNNTGSLVALWPVDVANIFEGLKHHAANPCSVWWVSPLWFWALQLLCSFLEPKIQSALKWLLPTPTHQCKALELLRSLWIIFWCICFIKTPCLYVCFHFMLIACLQLEINTSKTVADLGGIQGCERTPLWTLVNYYS